MARKFWTAEVKVTVISDEPIQFESLTDLDHLITVGGASGDYRFEIETVGPHEALAIMKTIGTDPGFFGLNEDGSDQYEE